MTTVKPYCWRSAGSANTYMLVGGQRLWLNGWPMANQHGVFMADVNIVDASSPLNTLPVIGPVPPGP